MRIDGRQTDGVQIDVLTRRLERLDTAQLADLLRRRPDVATPEPHGLTELAARLVYPFSLVEVLQQQSLPSWQAIEAALALGDVPTRSGLIDFLHSTDDAHAHHVDDILAALHDVAVLTVDGNDLHLPDALHRLFPNPLGLGQPLQVLLAQSTVDAMRQIARTLGLERPRSRVDAEHALSAYFAEPGRLAALLADAPAGARALLSDLAAEAATDEEYDDDSFDAVGFYRSYTAYGPGRGGARHDDLAWAVARGLVLDVGYGYGWQVPAEVTRALRGPDYRAPFDVRPPATPGTATPGTATPGTATTDLSRESAAAATGFHAALLGVLDHLARHPLKALKSGGVGARELTKLAKTTVTDGTTLRLALELADALGLLTAGTEIGLAAVARSWRDAPPDEQYATIVRAWWTLGFTPTVDRDADGKPLRVLIGHREPPCPLCRLARQAMLDVLAGTGTAAGPDAATAAGPDAGPDADAGTDTNAATDRHTAAARVRWLRPAAHVSPPDDPLAHQWHEAELLGVIAGGALTPLGRALRSDSPDTDDLAQQARILVPPAAQHATFGSDLTVFAAGSPGGRVSVVLDSAADREGRGGAVTWRFSPASVRRAFDDGATAETLLADLAAVSQAELPQPLRFLIADVARRHGLLRLAPATSVVRSDDTALLALVAADRTLTKHGVRLLAPTVLAADVPVDMLLAALRSAGYFPVVDAPAGHEARAGSDGSHETATTSTARATTQPRAASGPDWHALATRLTQRSSRKKTAAHPPATTLTAKAIARLNGTLAPVEVTQLARAVDGGGRIGMDYVAATGKNTHRVVVDPQLVGTSLIAWCELRQDEREFTVSRIAGVYVV